MRNFLSYLFLIVTLANSALSCAPTQQLVDGSLSNLKTFAGIEPDFNALTTNAFTGDVISAASDLNCDFSNPSLCKWKNFPDGKDPLDQIDFILFTKTQTSLPWAPPVLGPGGTPATGQKLILVGARNSTPAASIYESQPIQCTKAQTTLSFRYWLYGEGKVQVVLFRAGKVPIQEVASKPAQAALCKIDSPTSGICSIPIPPISEPFQIGIRAYDLYTARGGMVLVDDINYVGTVCPPPTPPPIVGLDLGPGFVEKPAQIPTTDQPIISGTDLNCKTFDSQCLWMNIPEGKDDFSVGSGTIDPNKWAAATGTSVLPTGDFIFLRTDNPDFNSGGDLVSNPIPCIPDYEDVIVTFNYWQTAGTELQVCTVKDEQDISCESVSNYGDSPGPVTIALVGPEEVEYGGPEDRSFNVVFRASNYDSTQDFVALDNIEIEADVETCSGMFQTTEFPTLSTVEAPQFTTPPPAPVDPDVAACRRISCKFENKNACGYNLAIPPGVPTGFDFQSGIMQGGIFYLNIGQTSKEGYLGTYLSRGDGVLAVLESPAFQLKEIRRLDFIYDLSIQNTELWLCRGEFSPAKFQQAERSNCEQLFDGYVTGDFYKVANYTASAFLTWYDTKFFIVGNFEAGDSSIAPLLVDNFQLKKLDGTPLC